jgi:hypothetical protein
MVVTENLNPGQIEREKTDARREKAKAAGRQGIDRG